MYKYHFQVGSVDSFERKMEEAQEALGISLGEEVRLFHWPACRSLTTAPTLLLHAPLSVACIFAGQSKDQMKLVCRDCVSQRCFQHPAMHAHRNTNTCILRIGRITLSHHIIWNQVPITYVNEIGWQSEILRYAPTLLLIAAYIYITRRTMGGGLGGAGGMSGGGRNIFNVGKAQVQLLSCRTQPCIHHPRSLRCMLCCCSSGDAKASVSAGKGIPALQPLYLQLTTSCLAHCADG